MANVTENQKQTRRGHHLARTERLAPRIATTAFDALARAALPGPNFNARLSALLTYRESKTRVPLNTIRDWRRGRRNPPQ